MEATSLRFATAARTLARRAREVGLDAPGFRSPPRLPEVERSVQRRASGGVMVSVRYRGRPWVAVLGDMIEGVVVANELRGAAADRLRNALWIEVQGEVGRAAA